MSAIMSPLNVFSKTIQKTNKNCIVNNFVKDFCCRFNPKFSHLSNFIYSYLYFASFHKFPKKFRRYVSSCIRYKIAK